MHNATSAPNISYYDYIVIGGGTAGCPLAATLSQNYSVLVLERGGSPYGNPNITNLAAFGAALSDTSPTSPSQRFISEDGVINSRARVLGGGSCINAGFYTRASPRYVRYAICKTQISNVHYIRPGLCMCRLINLIRLVSYGNYTCMHDWSIN